MLSSGLFRWSFTCQDLAVNARSHAKTTRIKSDIFETPVILVPETSARFVSEKARYNLGQKITYLTIIPDESFLGVIACVFVCVKAKDKL